MSNRIPQIRSADTRNRETNHHIASKTPRCAPDIRFKELAGTSVNAAIRNQQLADVCEKLVQTKDPIETIARLCGFPNSNYLQALFKKHFGMTMRAWRFAGLHFKSVTPGTEACLGQR